MSLCRSRNAALAGVFFRSRVRQQRKLSLPAVTDSNPAGRAAVVYGCVSMSTRLDPKYPFFLRAAELLA